ncbi:MAG: SUMF1/EgtB/PvdO family nonheme iron enzyme [Byssovorax sp.]
MKLSFGRRWPLGFSLSVLLGCAPPPRPPPPPPVPPPEVAAASCPDGMVAVAGGMLRMDARRPEVAVATFCLDRNEVTVDRYNVCIDAGECPAAPLGTFSADGRESFADPACNTGKFGRGDHPVNCVDWAEASAFCASKGGRLPTEEELAWAAQGGPRGTTFPWGNEDERSPNKVERVCWRKGTSFAGTCPVGSFPAGDSPLGIHDLGGNVWEWTASPYEGRERVIRGGSWILTSLADMNARSRYGYLPEVRDSDLGFRCARSL